MDWTLNVLLPALELFLAFIIFVYHYYLLFGIRALAQEVELPKIARKVKRNWILTILYYVLTLIGIMTGYAGLTERFPYLMYLNPLLALFGVLWIVLNTIQIIFLLYVDLFAGTGGYNGKPALVPPKKNRRADT